MKYLKGKTLEEALSIIADEPDREDLLRRACLACAEVCAEDLKQYIVGDDGPALILDCIEGLRGENSDEYQAMVWGAYRILMDIDEHFSTILLFGEDKKAQEEAAGASLFIQKTRAVIGVLHKFSNPDPRHLSNALRITWIPKDKQDEVFVGAMIEVLKGE